MAERASAGSKIFVGLFVVLVFPTGALLLQRHLGVQAEQDQGQKQSQTQKVEITIHNRPGAAGGTVKEPEPRKVPPAVVTLAALNENPAAFDGRILQLDAELSGKVFEEPTRCRLYVKDRDLLVDAKRIRDPGINFIVLKQQQPLLDGFTAQYVPVKLTVTVKQGLRGYWLAVVSAIEKTEPKKGPAAKEGATTTRDAPPGKAQTYETNEPKPLPQAVPGTNPAGRQLVPKARLEEGPVEGSNRQAALAAARPGTEVHEGVELDAARHLQLRWDCSTTFFQS
jgi:hypothetical protein